MVDVVKVDARLLQISTLGTLLVLQIGLFDLGSDAWQAAVTIASTVAAQAALSRVCSMSFDWRSPVITGCSLSLLLRTHSPLLWIAAGVLAIGSKFLLRAGGKHVFNPACFAIVVLLLTSDHVWVSPGIWGSAMWLGFLLASCAGLVLGRAARVDIALAFFGAYGGLLVVRCLALGDPMTIPWHQVQSGSLLLFGFFMITDPRSTPDARIGRVIFAVTVALLAYYGQFVLQSRVSLFFSLMVAAPMVPLLDYIFQASRFQWTPMQDATQ